MPSTRPTPTRPLHAVRAPATAGALLLAAACAFAQTSAPTSSSPDPMAAPARSAAMPSMPSFGGTDYPMNDRSWLPYTRGGYVGLNLGRPDLDLPCGIGGCDDAEVGGKLYTGGMLTDWLGAELGYVNMGRADRGGGRTEAYGLYVDFVGRLPMGRAALFAKLGTTYGRTTVGADALSGVVAGKDSGWGPNFGFGAEWRFSPQSSVVLEWERHDFHFQGEGREAVDMTSIGYVHRF